MKLLNELRLRESALLKYYERICLSDKMEDRFEIEPASSFLWLLSHKINEVEQNKIKFINNPQIIMVFLLEFDEIWSHIY